MDLFQPFSPHYGNTIALTITAAQSTTAFTADKELLQVALTNVGTAVVFMRLQPTADTTAASVTDMPILPNTQIIVTRGIRDSYTLRATAAGAGSVLYVTPGMGF